MGAIGGTPDRDWRQDRVLVLMSPGRDRQLVAEWLDTLGEFTVLVCDPADAMPEAYDLCLLDAAGLRARREELATRDESSDPVFLPYLLVVPAEDDGTEAALSADLRASAGTLVDDVLTVPVGKETLYRRLENLLQSRRASVRLAERGEQYQELVDLLPEAILLVRDGLVVYANAAAADVFGAADDDGLLGRAVDELEGDDADGSLTRFIDEIRETGRADSFRDLRLSTLQGSSITATVAGVAVTYEGQAACQLVVRDVTDQRRRQERLTLYGRALEAAAQGITIADAQQDDLPLIYANEAFERITGYDGAEILGRNCRFLQGRDTDPETVAEIRDALEACKPVSVEILNYRRDGTPFWNRLDIVPVADEEGTVTHFLGLQRDVTEHKQQTERLEVLDRVLRHNIRNRMNVILGYARQLRGAVDDAHTGAIDEIVNAADDLLQLTEQVREFQSVVATGDRDRQALDLAGTLDRIATGFREAYPRADVSLDLETDVPVLAHATLAGALEEVFELAVAEDGPPPSLAVRTAADDDEVVLEVVDRAGTMPCHDLGVIERASETPLEHSEGLELWLIRWAVVSSGGELLVDRSETPRLELRFKRADTATEDRTSQS